MYLIIYLHFYLFLICTWIEHPEADQAVPRACSYLTTQWTEHRGIRADALTDFREYRGVLQSTKCSYGLGYS